MALAHQSIATISSPQFINLTPLDINPLMSACDIKVFYIGENRNRSFISKQVATEMAKTLRGAPIVGCYKEEKEDFRDHGQVITMDSEGIHFSCETVPYGFVSPDAKVWFKDFEDIDEFGNSVIRTYLMTTGYLWTGQFKQVQKVFDDNGKPHSMELDEKNLQGKWATNSKTNMEFFIINDAIFSKLCILGDDIEPCFQGSGIMAPEISKTFSLDNEFKHTLFTMMEELRYALRGGNTVKKTTEMVNEVVEENITTEFTENQVNENESSSSESVQEPSETFVKKDDEEDKKDDSKDNTSQDNSEGGGESSEDKKEDSNTNKEDDEDKKKKFTVLETEYKELQSSYAALEEEVKQLRAFKQQIEDEKKSDLINDFYMLSDEDKKDVVEHMSEYSYEEIKSKLAVICFEKKVNFNLDNTSEKEEMMKDTVDSPAVTFSIQDTDSTPDWVKAVESNM